jgi:hypothetical protein
MRNGFSRIQEIQIIPFALAKKPDKATLILIFG